MCPKFLPVQRSMTWLLMVLLTFPGCLCSTWCLGQSHEDHDDVHSEYAVAHICDSHHHHHCCSHENTSWSEPVIYEIQSSFQERQMGRVASTVESMTLKPSLSYSFAILLPSSIPKPSGRDTLVMYQRFLIWAKSCSRNLLMRFLRIRVGQHADSRSVPTCMTEHNWLRIGIISDSTWCTTALEYNDLFFWPTFIYLDCCCGLDPCLFP